MKLKDTGLTAEELKGLVNKYMIETYERFDFIAETAKGMYIYDEKGNAYLDFYAGIAVNSAGNCNEKVIAAIQSTSCTPSTIRTPFRRRCWLRRSATPSAWIRSTSRTRVLRRTRL